MFAIGYDIGSSSIKAALVNLENGKVIDIVQHPSAEMSMISKQAGWAEQNPEDWWVSVCHTTRQLLSVHPHCREELVSIGISYQMHGLVLVDKQQKVLRPSIIWCDSRAVEIGEKAHGELGSDYCMSNLLNTPGNFTASKLRWVRENETDIYDQIDQIMLPGDYVAMKLTGDTTTTVAGLSEGIFWDFKNHQISEKIIANYQLNKNYFPSIVSTTGLHGELTKSASAETGLPIGVSVTYRAGDQPNNALSLNVLQPGEIAATGGTSGVVFGVTDQLIGDTESRINSFAHVNHRFDQVRIGQLLCINGAGSQYAWIKKQLQPNSSYENLENLIRNVDIGADGLRIIPFGNGAERMINNKMTGGQVNNLQFQKHTHAHLIRAALEGIAFSFVYGIDILKELGVDTGLIKVGNDNLFQSKIFAQTISNLLQCKIQMMDTTGAVGAALASGIAINQYDSFEEAVSSTQTIKSYTPERNNTRYLDAFSVWANDLENLIKR